MTIGLLLTALGLGLRHGVDWDHIAAIADLSSTAESRRRGFWLSFLYAVGHGAVVLAVGAVAIAFGSTLPDGVDAWMGRVVGVTFLVLGVWILVDLARKGRDFRLRSRWILVLNGTFAGLRRVRDARSGRRLTVEHSHPHDHIEPPEPSLTAAHDPAAEHDPAPTSEHGQGDSQVHDHSHLVAEPAPVLVAAAEPEAPTDAPGRWAGSAWRSRRHAHPHRHEVVLADDVAGGPGNGTAAGIGVLHGVGVESPTQIAVFVASTSVVGVGAGVALLAAWVVGLILANSVLAVLAGLGLLSAERNFGIYLGVAIFVAVASIAMGALLVAGLDVLPAL